MLKPLKIVSDFEVMRKNDEIDKIRKMLEMDKNHLSNEKITKLLEEMDDENKSLLSKYYEEQGNQSTNEGQKTSPLYNNKPDE